MSLHEFLTMGGFAIYVWPSYAIFFIVLAADLAAPRLRRRRLVRELRARMQRQAARKVRSDATSTPPSAPRTEPVPGK